MNKYFNMDESVFDITERFPETIRYLAGRGFTPLTNPLMRKMLGKKISLEKALLSKSLDVTLCEKELIEIIEKNKSFDFAETDLSLKKEDAQNITYDDGKKNIRIEGVLPCL